MDTAVAVILCGAVCSVLKLQTKMEQESGAIL